MLISEKNKKEIKELLIFFIVCFFILSIMFSVGSFLLFVSPTIFVAYTMSLLFTFFHWLGPPKAAL